MSLKIDLRGKRALVSGVSSAGLDLSLVPQLRLMVIGQP